MTTYCEKYGSSSWNAGRTRTSQTGVLVGHKRCSKQVDPRCIAEEGIHSLNNFRIYRPHAPTPQMAYCRFCESFLTRKRQRRPERITNFKAYQKQYSREKYERMKYDTGFKILYDPSGAYQHGALFGRRDFKQTLADGIWPEQLIVRDLKTNECFQVHAMEIEEVADRDWFIYRKEQLA